MDALTTVLAVVATVLAVLAALLLRDARRNRAAMAQAAGQLHTATAQVREAGVLVGAKGGHGVRK